MLTSIPSNNIPLQTWILCTDTAQQKLNLMTVLRKLKIKRQRENGIERIEKELVSNEVPNE